MCGETVTHKLLGAKICTASAEDNQVLLIKIINQCILCPGILFPGICPRDLVVPERNDMFSFLLSLCSKGFEKLNVHQMTWWLRQ